MEEKLTLRQWYKGMALQGLIQMQPNGEFKVFAMQAGNMADEMIEEDKKHSTPKGMKLYAAYCPFLNDFRGVPSFRKKDIEDSIAACGTYGMSGYRLQLVQFEITND